MERMRESTYIRMTSSLHANPALERAVCLANKLITYAIYLAYPCLIAWLFFSGGWPAAIINDDWSTFAVPASSVAAATGSVAATGVDGALAAASGAASAAATGADPAAAGGAGLLGLVNARAGTPIDSPSALLYALLVPGISFVLVTILRRAVNAPRPYTVFNTPPVIPKDTIGNSFPSRHTFSIFIIGMTFCACCPLPWSGPVVLALGCVLAALRVVGGVHFPRDVIAGAAAGIALGWIGFWVL